MKTSFFTIISLIAVTALFLFPDGVLAEIPSKLIPECNWRTETYGLGAFVELAQNVLKLIWGIIGSLALVMFVWGGFLWLTARGEDEQVKKGWDTLINAVIGLVIILGSWVIINTVILAFTSPGQWTPAKLFGDTSWSQLAGGEKCVALLKRKPGFAPALVPVTAATGGGDGVCCLESSFGATSNKRVNEERCKQLLLQTANGGAQRAKAYYCPSSEDETVCGTKEIRGGARHNPDDRSGEYWRMNCASGQRTYEVVDKGEPCAGSTKLCKNPYTCLLTGEGMKCVSENEPGKCVVIIKARLGSEDKNFVASYEINKSRVDCKNASYNSSTIIHNSQTWNVVATDDIRWCEKDASDGSVWAKDNSSGVNAAGKEFGRWGRTCVSVK